MRLSVVIPTHDTRGLTLACLESLARSDAEVLVVDDGSRDGTSEAIAARFPAVRVLRNDPAQGFTLAANRGLEEARGEVLLLLNSDTEVEPGALEALLARFEAEPRTGAIGAALHYPDGSPQWSGGEEPSLAWLFGLASGLPPLLARLPLYRRAKPLTPAGEARSVGWVTGAALALRREAWSAAGPLDERFRLYAQDLDLCLRVRQAGWEVRIAPDFRVLHHHGATIGRRNPGPLWTDLLRWARKHRGERWAAQAGRALRWGAALRLAGRRLLPARSREEDRVLRDALRALSSE